MSEGDRERRLRERMRLALPARVEGREAGGEAWAEQTRLIDLTPFGASFTLTRPVDTGRILRLTLPMPRQLRCFDHIEDQYRVYALVRRLKLAGTEGAGGRQLFELGAAFVGKHAPPSYAANPATRYEIEPTGAGGELWRAQEATGRAHVEDRDTRLTMPVEVVVEVLDAHGATVASEQTVTENISRRGAAVFTTLRIERGSFVRLRSVRYSLAALSVVRARRRGADNIDRLHLEFIDRQWPLEILE